MGCPTQRGWLEGLRIPGEGQLQTEQPMSDQGGNWKVVLELQGAARSRGADLGIFWYLKSWSDHPGTGAGGRRRLPLTPRSLGCGGAS